MKITFVKYPVVITYAKDSAKYYISFVIGVALSKSNGSFMKPLDKRKS